MNSPSDFPPALPRPGRPARTSPPSAGIDRISHVHEQIANWLILNPDRTQAECALHFGYTQSHLSRIINSDAFRALLESKHKEVFAHVCKTVPEKLNALADLAIEKVAEQLEKSDNPSLIVDVFDKTLHRLGYGPQKPSGPTVQQQFLFVNPEDLAAARQRILQNDQGNLEAQVGGALPSPSSIPEGEQTARAETPGR